MLFGTATLASAAAVNSCLTKITFENNFDARIKVQQLRLKPVNMSNTSGNDVEDFSNITIAAGERGSTNKKRRMFGNDVSGALAMKNGESRSSIRVVFKLWEPQNNRWVDRVAGIFTRTCRNDGNMFFKLDSSKVIQPYQ